MKTKQNLATDRMTDPVEDGWMRAVPINMTYKVSEADKLCRLTPFASEHTLAEDRKWTEKTIISKTHYSVMKKMNDET